jgi:hypothetical protein
MKNKLTKFFVAASVISSTGLWACDYQHSKTAADASVKDETTQTVQKEEKGETNETVAQQTPVSNESSNELNKN